MNVAMITPRELFRLEGGMGILICAYTSYHQRW